CMGRQRKSQFTALLFGKHRRVYRERFQRRPPLGYYASTAAMLACIACASAGRPPAATVAALVWLALTAEFCARRLRGTAHSASHVAEMAVTSALIPLLSIYWRLRGAVRFRVLF